MKSSIRSLNRRCRWSVVTFAVLCLMVGTFAHAAAPTTQPAGPFVLAGKVEGACLTEHTPFSQDGARFSTESANEEVRVWDSRTLKPLTELLSHPSLQFHRLSGDGKTVMTAGGQEVRLWDVATSKLRSVAKVTDKEEFSFADLSPDGKRFVTIEKEDIFTLCVWEAGVDRPVFKLRHQGVVQSAEFDPTGKLIVTHELGVGFRVWGADTGREARPLIESDDDFFVPYRTQFDPTGHRLVVPRKNGFVVVESSVDKMVAEVKFARRNINNVRFIAGGAKVAVSFWWPEFDPPLVAIHDIATGMQEREARMGECQTGPVGRWALGQSAGHKPSAEVWDLSTGAKVQTLPVPFEGTGSLSFMSPDGLMFLVESAPSLTSVWRLRKELRETQAFRENAGSFWDRNQSNLSFTLAARSSPIIPLHVALNRR